MEPIGPDTLVFVASGGTDVHGDPLPDGAEDMIEGCMVYPKTTSEDDGRTSSTEEILIALLPVPRDRVQANQTCRYDGETYHVSGKPQQWRHLDGEDACTQIQLLLGEG